MKKIIFTLGALIGFTSIFAQEPYPCHTDEKTTELIESLTPQQKAEFFEAQNSYEQEIQEYIAAHPELLTSSNERGTISYVIPVVFHILHEGGTENISNEQVFDAVEHMNKDFQKLNQDVGNTIEAFQSIVADAEIEFRLAKLDPNGNCTNGITRTYSAQTHSGNGQAQINAIKSAHGNWPGDQYLNIFVCRDIGGAAGYTSYPFPTQYGGSAMSNGIFVLYNYCGSIGAAGSNGRHTLSHEAGHWLNLAHLWGNSNEPGVASNCNTDDGVADTPNTMGWTTCNLNGSTCDGTLDNVQNFMEYSYCSTMFTNGQKARMHAALNSSVGGRNKVWTSANLNSTGVNLPDVLCAAEFNSDLQEICLGGEITFHDMSYNNVVGWQWEFEGGTPATSNQQHPVVTYNTPGIFEVKLTATDGTNSVSEVKTNYISVLPTGVDIPLIEGFENLSSLENSDLWIVENPGNNAKFEITTETSYSGSKSIKLQNFGQQSNNIDAIISNPIDLSSIDSEDGVTLSCRYAYRKRSSGNQESFNIYISNSCGKSWALRKTLTGNMLGTETATTTWKPESKNDWVTVHMTNITSPYWIDNFRVKFEFVSGGGNNFYLDDINIYSGDEQDDPLGIHENEVLHALSVYPNPADHEVNIEFSLKNNQKVEVALVDMMGQIVQSNVINGQNGKNLVLLDTKQVRSGMYLVKINSGGEQQIQRLVIK